MEKRSKSKANEQTVVFIFRRLTTRIDDLSHVLRRIILMVSVLYMFCKESK